MLLKLGRKGESYDRIIRRLIQRELPGVPDIDDLDVVTAAEEPGIPGDRIDWDEVFGMNDDEFQEWLKKMATA
jgi:hypothetical protein